MYLDLGVRNLERAGINYKMEEARFVKNPAQYQ
jgi:hypothetical protein